MTDICMLFDSVSTNTEIRQKAKDKLTARKEKATQLRIASMSSQVRKRDLMEAGDPVEVLSGIETVETANGEPCRKRVRAPKNQFANEVEGVLAGLKEKSEAFRNAILERERRDREREEREKEREEREKQRAEIEKRNADGQKELNTKLDVLINTMNIFVQHSLLNAKEPDQSSI